MPTDDTSENQYSDSSNANQHQESWQTAALMHIATASIQEQRRSRRWRVFFVLAFLAIAVFAITSVPEGMTGKSTPLSSIGGFQSPHVALISVHGVIIDAPLGAQQVHHDSIIQAMNNAAENKHCVGIILSVNSPGGGIFESARLHTSIKGFRAEYPNVDVMAVARDLALSGGLYISMAANKFFAHETSLVGSIGVIIPGFGLDEAIKNIGVKRRLVTSGPNKAIGDPFSPFSAEHRQRFQTIVDKMKGLFVRRVKESRGDRLTGDPKEIFSGAFWDGDQALAYGLIDGLGTEFDIAEREFGTSDLINYTIEQSPVEKFFNVSQRAIDLLGIFSGQEHAFLGNSPALKPYYLAF